MDCKKCLCEAVCKYNDGHNLYGKDDYYCPHFESKSIITESNITNKYSIQNVGCDDITVGMFDFTEERYRFLKDVFNRLNDNSTYGCMPKIYICKDGEFYTELS